MGENQQGQTPTQDQLQQWVDTYDLHHPVVADANWEITQRFTRFGSFSLPTMHQIGAGGRILKTESNVTEAEIQAALPAP